jgi:methylglutaconyl-CoA hydratase
VEIGARRAHGPARQLADAAREVAESILRTAPEARMMVKRMIHERYGAVDRMSMDWSLWKASEAREGMLAFAEKRSPAWVPKGIDRAGGCNSAPVNPHARSGRRRREA